MQITTNNQKIGRINYSNEVLILQQLTKIVEMKMIKNGESSHLHLISNITNNIIIINNEPFPDVQDRSIAVWDMQSPSDINLRRVLVGHRAAVNVVDFDDKYIVSASGDRTIKVSVYYVCHYVLIARSYVDTDVFNVSALM